MNKVSAYYEEGYAPNGVMGFYTQRIKDRKDAVKALEDFIQNDSEDFLENYKESNGEDFVFNKENVKETRYHTHRDCGMSTIDGDGYCVECPDHNFTSNGRITFIYTV